jgi:hypothetical protein
LGKPIFSLPRSISRIIKYEELLMPTVNLNQSVDQIPLEPVVKPVIQDKTYVVSDVPCNWRKAALGDKLSPKYQDMARNAVPDEMTVFIPWNAKMQPDVAEIKQWVAENLQEVKTVKIYSRYHWRRLSYMTEKKFVGLTFAFKNTVDHFYFKMRFTSALEFMVSFTWSYSAMLRAVMVLVIKHPIA